MLPISKENIRKNSINNMKTLKYLFALIALGLFFISCKEEKEPELPRSPDITKNLIGTCWVDEWFDTVTFNLCFNTENICNSYPPEFESTYDYQYPNIRINNVYKLPGVYIKGVISKDEKGGTIMTLNYYFDETDEKVEIEPIILYFTWM